MMLVYEMYILKEFVYTLPLNVLLHPPHKNCRRQSHTTTSSLSIYPGQATCKMQYQCFTQNNKITTHLSCGPDGTGCKKYLKVYAVFCPHWLEMVGLNYH